MVERTLTDLMQKVGWMVEAEAKRLCPVDTGRLRASITNQVNPIDSSVIIGTNVKYAPYVEYGTSRMNPQPFLRPAVDMTLRRIGARILERQ
jgi:HK97 gp10 family phage protein